MVLASFKIRFKEYGYIEVTKSLGNYLWVRIIDIDEKSGDRIEVKHHIDPTPRGYNERAVYNMARQINEVLKGEATQKAKLFNLINML